MEAIKNRLTSLGFSGSINDMLLAFYLANGATTRQISDAAFEYFKSLGLTSNTVPDLIREYFGNGNSIQDNFLAGPYPFMPLALFNNGEQGVWYDPSDLSTLFQDAAGTTPVTAVEQPVGLMLDKSRGLERGPELVTNGTFDNGLTGWTAYSSAPVSAVDGRLSFVRGGSVRTAYQLLSVVVGKTYNVAFDIKSNVSTSEVWIEATTVAGTKIAGSKQYSSGVNEHGSLVFTATTETVSLTLLYNSTSYGAASYIDNISVRELPGNHASQPTATARPVLKQDENGNKYLHFDGVDDWFSTPAIDFTGTDKMTVVAGIRKLSDAAVGVLAELSANIGSNNGAFCITAPLNTSGSTLAFASKGTLFSAWSVSGAPFAAPVTAVLTGVGNVSADEQVLRANGAQIQSLSNDQGTGNYGNYPLYIGRRGGASLPFNGHLYGLCIVGKLATDAQIHASERYLAGKTGVTLS